jgi:anti-sigma factor RsiW
MADNQPLTDNDRAEIVAYLDGELDGARSRAVEARINNDPRIRAEVDILRRTYDLLDYLPRPEPSPNFTNRTMDRLAAAAPTRSLQPRTPRRNSGWLVRLLAGAALVAAAVVGYAAAPSLPGWRTPRPAPDPTAELDKDLEKHLSVIERWRLYRNVADVQTANELDRPELFGDEHLGY